MLVFSRRGMKAIGLRQICRRSFSGATVSRSGRASGRARAPSTRKQHEPEEARRAMAKRPLAAITGGWASMTEEMAMPDYLLSDLSLAMKRGGVLRVAEVVKKAVECTGTGGRVGLPESVARRVLDYYLETGYWPGVQTIIHMPGGFPLDIDLCRRIQQAFGGPEHWRKSLTLLLLMQSRDVVPDLHLSRAIVQQLVDAGQLLEAGPFLKKLRAFGYVPPHLLFHTLDALAEQGMVGEARPIWEEARVEAAKEDRAPCLLNLMFKAYSRAGDAEGAVALLRRLLSEGERMDIVTFNTVLTACAKQARPDLAEKVYGRMGLRRVQPDARTFGALLDAYARSGDAAGAKRVFRQLRRSKVHPSIHCYAVMMKALAKECDLEGVASCMRDMEAAGVVFNEVVYSTAIYAWGVQGHLEEAMAYLQQAEEAGLCNTAVYFSMLHNYAKHAKCEEAVALLERMKARGVPPNTRCYNAAMAAARRAGRDDACLQLFDDMKASGLKPDHHTCNNLMTAAVRVDRQDVALDVARQVLSRRGQPVREMTWATAATLCVQEGRVDLAEAIFNTLCDARYPHLGKLASLFVVTFANGDRMELALRALRIPASSAPWIGQEGGAGHVEAAATEVSAEKSSIQRELTALILACGREGQWPVGMYLLDEALWRGEGVDTVMVSSALQCLDRASPEALRLLGPGLFGWALQQGFYPTFIATPGCLDLHEFTTAEAKAAITYHLGLDGRQPRPCDRSRLHVVVGKSRGVVPDGKEPDDMSLLNKEVTKLLQETPRWKVTRHTHNPGRLVVTYIGDEEKGGEAAVDVQQPAAAVSH